MFIGCTVHSEKEIPAAMKEEIDFNGSTRENIQAVTIENGLQIAELAKQFSDLKLSTF